MEVFGSDFKVIPPAAKKNDAPIFFLDYPRTIKKGN